MAEQWPKTMGACIDKLYSMRQKRLDVEHKVEEMKGEEKALSDYILNTFKKTDLEGAKGKLATAGVTQLTVAQVVDWDKLYGYIKKKGAWDLLQRRTNDKAFRDRWDDQQAIPGTQPFVVTKLSLTKVGGK